MVVRRRISLLVASLGLAAVSSLAFAPMAVGQDPTAPVAPEAATSVVDDPGTDQTVVESPTSDRRLATENRRILAIIGALVAVALGLTVLTIRYVRATRPVTGAVPDEAPPRRRRRSRKAVAGADHATADADWTPRATGEHTAVAPAPATPAVRPDTSARRKALGLPADR